MCGGNDATTYSIAKGNCSYCAIGALLARRASEVMRDVYTMMGKPLPTGISKATDGADGFAELYLHSRGFIRAPIPLGILGAQIKGIETYLGRKGCGTRRLKGKGEFEFLRPSRAVDAILGESEGTLFLVLTTIYIAGHGVGNTGAHWAVGQVQYGNARFFDHQLKVSEENVRKRIVRWAKTEKIKAMIGKTRVTDLPPGPFGSDLEERDGRVLIVVVSREGMVLPTVASGDIHPGPGAVGRADDRFQVEASGQFRSRRGFSGPG